MIEFIIYLVVIFALGFIGLTVQSAIKKRTVPQPNELTTQFSGVSAVESVEQAPRFTKPVKNSHWHRHTFERPRRKAKR